MTAYEWYTFILSFIVLASLTAIFTVFLRMMIMSYLKLVRNGLEDEAILEEYSTEKKATPLDIINNIASIVICAVLIIVFIFSTVINITENKNPFGLPSLSVVKSSSMSYKYSKNTYLEQNGLDDQFDMFDIIVVDAIPDEFDIELYDVIVYEMQDGTLVVHRVIEIEEPNSSHPDHRYFKFRGDAVDNSDRYPVLYSQMKGIYSGHSIKFVGSFVMFMQSPAGWICILLVIFAMIATPIIEKKLDREKRLRLALICPVCEPQPEPEPEPIDPEIIEIKDELSVILELSRSQKADIRAFNQKLISATAQMQKHYVHATRYLYSIPEIRYSYSEQYQKFRYQNKLIAKLCLKKGNVYAYINADISKIAEIDGAYTLMPQDSVHSECNVKIKLCSDESIELMKQFITINMEDSI